MEAVERLRPGPSYESGGLLDAQRNFGGNRMLNEYGMPILDRSPSLSTYCSSGSSSASTNDEHKGIDALLFAQQRQMPYDIATSSATVRAQNS